MDHGIAFRHHRGIHPIDDSTMVVDGGDTQICAAQVNSDREGRALVFVRHDAEMYHHGDTEAQRI